MVIDSAIGSSRPSLLLDPLVAWIAALAFSVIEHRLGQDRVDAALGQRLDLLDIDVGQRVEVDLAIAGDR